MKRLIAIITLAAAATGCASTRVDTPDTDAWHRRVAEESSKQQDLRALTASTAVW